MSEPTLPIVEKLRRQSQCIYLATEATVADDVSASMIRSADTITDLVEAGERVLAGLNARIDHAAAEGACVPLFDGISELHAALTKAKSE